MLAEVAMDFSAFIVVVIVIPGALFGLWWLIFWLIDRWGEHHEQ